MVRRSVMARTKEATELDRQIGMQLRLLRVTRDKTQEWLAEQLGLTVPASAENAARRFLLAIS
jgi:hypothetical protein